jgi:hypothetical protein
MYQRSITLYSNRQTAHRCYPIGTVVSQYRWAWFAHRYYGTRGTRTVVVSIYSSDVSSNISRPLLLPPTIAMGYMTLDDHCYCGARGTRMASTRCNNSDGPSDISGLLLLPPAVETGYMTLDDHSYC